MFVSSRSLPFRVKLPFDVSDGWRLSMLYGFQVVSTFYLLQHILFVDLYGMCCMNECSLHLSIVSNEFQILDEIPRSANVSRTYLLMESKNRLRHCIRRHQQIIKWVSHMLFDWNQHFLCHHFLQIRQYNFTKVNSVQIIAIRLTDDINRIFEIKLFAQFIGSLSIICLTAFEATVTLSDKMACMKFIVYMFAAFTQLFVWCWIGNKIYYQVKVHQSH